MLYIVLILIVLGAVVLFLTMRNTGGRNPVTISARLGRFGLAGETEASQPVVVQEHTSHNAVTQGVDRIVGRGGFGARLTSRLEQADLKMTPGEWISVCGAAFVVALIVGLLLKGILGMLGLGVLGIFVPQFYLRRRIKKRKKAFTEQLADMAQMMGNSMRAGFSIIQAMELVGNEGPSPSADEFQRVVTEVKLGLPLDTALEHLQDRQPGEDLELMVVAINVQRQVGGNLSEILAVISQTIRERVRFERELKAMTAQARYSSYIITGLPVGVGAVINFMDHEYESYLYTAMMGRIMLGIAICMIGLGFFFLNRIANIEV